MCSVAAVHAAIIPLQRECIINVTAASHFSPQYAVSVINVANIH
jgi:hypothetical protein